MSDPAIRPAADSQPALWSHASLAGRIVGLGLCLEYLAGFVDGSLIAVGAAICLMVVADNLLRDDPGPSLGAIVVFGSALLVGALRWATVAAGELRGIQGVLGPTVVVAPAVVAGGCIVALASAVVMLGAALPGPRKSEWGTVAWWVAELLVGALALVTVYWGPVVTSGERGWGPAGFHGLLGWAAATTLVALAAGGSGVTIGRLSPRIRWWIAGAGAVTTAMAATLVVSAR